MLEIPRYELNTDAIMQSNKESIQSDPNSTSKRDDRMINLMLCRHPSKRMVTNVTITNYTHLLTQVKTVMISASSLPVSITIAIRRFSREY